MHGIWVLFELVPLAVLTALVCGAVVSHAKDSGGAGDWEGPAVDASRNGHDDYGEPEWWPDFERDFALYVARIEPGRQGETAPGPKGEAGAPRPRRPQR
jgi:hypothetical protein